MEESLLISALIFIATYTAIITGKVQRSVAALVGAVAMVVAGLSSVSILSLRSLFPL